MFELAQRDASEVADLRRTVDIDAGYLSRILTRFESDGLISRQRSAADGRRQVIRLTEAGRHVVAGLDARSAGQTRDMLAAVPDEDRRRLLDAMRVITDVLSGSPRPRGYLLRAPAGGRHGLGGAAERGGVRGGVRLGRHLRGARGQDRRRLRRPPRPGCEAAWIAEVDGTRAGCVFCVRENATTARLRLLLVEPWARGSGSAPGWSRRCSGSPARPATPHHAVDQRRADRRPADLPAGRFHFGRREPSTTASART